jgi:tetratricopeptide (TPR) repeat protein
MRALALVSVLATAGTAAAGPKQLPPRLAKAASTAFLAAREADAKGDLETARAQYQRAIDIAPHPDTYFNLADVEVRRKVIASAIEAYEKYLELAVEAKDRKVVEKRLAELRAMKGTLEIEMNEPDGVVFLNGVPSGKVPGKVDVLAGTYSVDIITPITAGSGTCEATALRSSTCHVGAAVREDGNVVMGATWSSLGGNWFQDGQEFHLRGRFTLKPGTYQLMAHDRQCAPVTLVVPKGDVVTYAFITLPEAIKSDRGCVPLKIQQRRVTFD